MALLIDIYWLCGPVQIVFQKIFRALESFTPAPQVVEEAVAFRHDEELGGQTGKDRIVIKGVKPSIFTFS